MASQGLGRPAKAPRDLRPLPTDRNLHYMFDPPSVMDARPNNGLGVNDKYAFRGLERPSEDRLHKVPSGFQRPPRP